MLYLDVKAYHLILRRILLGVDSSATTFSTTCSSFVGDNSCVFSVIEFFVVRFSKDVAAFPRLNDGCFVQNGNGVVLLMEIVLGIPISSMMFVYDHAPIR